jgi:protein-S-isoprenylcysteine O-methyltransferase Ste14
MSQESGELTRRVLAALVLPVSMTIIIPAIILYMSNSTLVGWGLPFPLSLVPTAVGLLLIVGGVLLIVRTVSMFRSIGQGTLAPWDATRRLVVVGVYRYVRNPMISGVFAVILGESILFGSPPLVVFSLLFAVTNLIYIPLSEEPGLHKRFGAEYAEYSRNVPRWIPRRTPWSPS